MLYIGEGEMTFEEKRRAAFEEWYRDQFGTSALYINGELTNHASACYKAWQAALDWQNKP